MLYGGERVRRSRRGRQHRRMHCRAILLRLAVEYVALKERHPDPNAHKALITHLIRPNAVPRVERLVLTSLTEEAGGTSNGTEIRTGWGRLCTQTICRAAPLSGARRSARCSVASSHRRLMQSTRPTRRGHPGAKCGDPQGSATKNHGLDALAVSGRFVYA